MGCCSSTPTASGSTKGKPFKREGLVWTAREPLTRFQLDQQRSTFWETEPTYEGRPEIWQALQAAFQSTDLTEARSILDAANVILRTGNPAEGCYDELGNSYHIPMYILVDPTNLITDEQPLSSQMAVQAQPTPASLEPPETTSPDYPIIVRLSTAQDLKMLIHGHHEPVETLISNIFAHPDVRISHDMYTVRLIYLGKVLDRKAIIIGNDIPAANGTPAPTNAIRVNKEDVIQAFVTLKPRE